MATKTLEELIKEDLGAKDWIILCQRQRIETLERALADAQSAKDRPATPATVAAFPQATGT